MWSSQQLSNSVNIDFAYSHIHLLWFFHLCLHFFELLSTSCQSRHKIYKMGEKAIIWWFLLKIYTHGFFFLHFKMNRVTKLRRVEDMGEGAQREKSKIFFSDWPRLWQQHLTIFAILEPKCCKYPFLGSKITKGDIRL